MRKNLFAILLRRPRPRPGPSPLAQARAPAKKDGKSKLAARKNSEKNAGFSPFGAGYPSLKVKNDEKCDNSTHTHPNPTFLTGNSMPKPGEGSETSPRGFSKPWHRISCQKCVIWMHMCRVMSLFVVFEGFGKLQSPFSGFGNPFLGFGDSGGALEGF